MSVVTSSDRVRFLDRDAPAALSALSAVSYSDTGLDDLDRAFATVPRSAPPTRVCRPGHRAERRPNAGVLRYDRRVSGGGPGRGSHPLAPAARAQVGFVALAVAALLTAITLIGIFGLAQLRAGDFGERYDTDSSAVFEAPAAPMVPIGVPATSAAARAR